MNERRYYDEYDEATAERCERALITLIGDLGPWGKRIYLAGGLAPRYLVGSLPEDARVHVGTTDVDLVIGLALGDDMPETYRTLHENLKEAGFKQGEPSLQWTREVDGVKVDGGTSKVTVRVANVLTYTVLKILAFQERHENKDAYDLVFTLLNGEGGPGGEAARRRREAVATVRAFTRAFNG